MLCLLGRSMKLLLFPQRNCNNLKLHCRRFNFVQVPESTFKIVQLRAGKNNVRPPHWNKTQPHHNDQDEDNDTVDRTDNGELPLVTLLCVDVSNPQS